MAHTSIGRIPCTVGVSWALQCGASPSSPACGRVPPSPRGAPCVAGKHDLTGSCDFPTILSKASGGIFSARFARRILRSLMHTLWVTAKIPNQKNGNRDTFSGGWRQSKILWAGSELWNCLGMFPNCLETMCAKFYKCFGGSSGNVLEMGLNMFRKRLGMCSNVFSSISVRGIVTHPAKSFVGALRAPISLNFCEIL